MGYVFVEAVCITIIILVLLLGLSSLLMIIRVIKSSFWPTGFLRELMFST